MDWIGKARWWTNSVRMAARSDRRAIATAMAALSRMLACRLGGRRDDAFQLSADGRHLTAQPERGDLYSLFHVLVNRAYDHPDVEWSGLRTVVDVGANIGAFTLFAAERARQARVFCFEPGVSAVRSLRANLHDNGLEDRVRVFEQAPSCAEAGARSRERAGSFSGTATIGFSAIAAACSRRRASSSPGWDHAFSGREGPPRVRISPDRSTGRKRRGRRATSSDGEGQGSKKAAGNRDVAQRPAARWPPRERGGQCMSPTRRGDRMSGRDWSRRGSNSSPPMHDTVAPRRTDSVAADRCEESGSDLLLG